MSDRGFFAMRECGAERDGSCPRGRPSLNIGTFEAEGGGPRSVDNPLAGEGQKTGGAPRNVRIGRDHKMRQAWVLDAGVRGSTLKFETSDTETSDLPLDRYAAIERDDRW